MSLGKDLIFEASKIFFPDCQGHGGFNLIFGKTNTVM